MAPLIVLSAGFALARLAGLLGVDALDGQLPALRVGLAVMFVLPASPTSAPSGGRAWWRWSRRGCPGRTCW